MTGSEQAADHTELNEAPGARFVGSRWSRTFIQPALVVISTVSLYSAVILLLASVSSSSPWMGLIPFAAFVSLEAVSTTMWLDHPDRRQIDHTIYRISEFLVVMVIVRIVTWGISDSWPRVQLLPNYLRSPLALIDDPLFWITMFLMGVVWLHTLVTTHSFSLLAIDWAEASYYATPSAVRKTENKPLPLDRGVLVENYFRQWIGGAVVLVLCITLASIDLPELASSESFQSITRMPLPPGGLLALIAYVFSGLMLLSQARLAAMNARWLIGGSTKDSRVERSWHRNSFWLLLIMAAIAALLPIGSTPSARPILTLLIEGIFDLFGLVAAFFVGLLSLLFPKSDASTVGSSEPAGPMVPPELPPAGQPNETLALILSSLFWAVVIFVTITALVFFLRDRVKPIDVGRLRLLWRTFISWITALFQDTKAQVSAVGQAIRDLVRENSPRLGDVGRSRLRYIRFNDLSPRQQLRYIYLSTIQRAEKRGVERRPSETPLEYAQELKDHWPENEADVDSLTDAFLKARYSPRAVEPEEVSLIRAHWKRLRSRLRKRYSR